MRHFVSLCTLLLILSAPSAPAADVERILVRCDTGCERLAAAVDALNGEVTHRYRYVDGLAATVPGDRYAELLEHPDAITVWKDAELPAPEPTTIEIPGADEITGAGGVDALGRSALGALTEEPRDFLYNTALTGARGLHLRGHTGDGVIVAVIDTGVVNRPGHVLYGKVLGGVTFAPSPHEVPSATSRRNHPHGTGVSCMIAADAFIDFYPDSPIGRALAAHAPESVFACDGLLCPPERNWTPMLGTAPDVRLYAIKYWGGFSDLLAAMEHAILLKRNYDAGVPSLPVAGDGSEDDPFVYDSLNVQVVNMSYGFKTLFAAHELKEQLVTEMLEADMVPVVASGNECPGAMTVNNPGSAHGALTVGFGATVPHAGIWFDLDQGPGVGALAVPAEHPQVTLASARGPSADGRLPIDLVSNGFAALVQGPRLVYTLDSGSSASTPTVTGAAALLRGAVPEASAAEVRAALIAGGSPDVLGDGSAPIDRGHGWADIPAALALLEAGGLDTTLERGPEAATVAGNIAPLGFKTLRLGTDGRHTARVEDLRPGQVAHFSWRAARRPISSW